MRRSHGVRAFTLTELLIVMVIIAILAGIAIPMYLTSRERAKDASVKAATHSIEVGLGSYGVDHDDFYPAALADKTVLVDAGGASYIDAWPANPWTNADVKDSVSQGDYTYTRIVGGRSFTLAGHMSTGDFVAP